MKHLKEIKHWKELINEVVCGDCLEGMKLLPNKCVDLVLTDPPYGTTNCAWDSIITLEPMWEQLKRIIRPNGAIVMTASQPFTTMLVSSNLEMFKYCWVWEKPSAKGHLNAQKRPMVAHEDIVVFYRSQPTYNPQKTFGHQRKVSKKHKALNSEVYNKNTKTVSYDSDERYPRSVLRLAQDTQQSSLHPTQKPLALMSYLIKTYSKNAELVLDFCMGSWTTARACKDLGRNFIGFELSEKYCKIGEQRLRQQVMF